MGECRVAEINHRALSYYPRLARLKAYCIAHFDEEISLEQAAEAMRHVGGGHASGKVAISVIGGAA